MEEMKRSFSISRQIVSLKSENDRVTENELEIYVDVTGVHEDELFEQFKMCIPPEIRLKSASIGYGNKLDGSKRKGEIYNSPNGITVSYSESHYVDFDSVSYSLHDENGHVIIQLFYSIPMVNRYELLGNIPFISITLVGSEGSMVFKRIPLSESAEFTEFNQHRQAERARMRLELEHDDDIDDGVYAVPSNPDEPKIKVRKLLDYCKEKGVKPGSLSPEEMKQFFDYDKPPKKPLTK